MTLESIVTSLEMNKKLEEVGFDAETCFYWWSKHGVSVHELIHSSTGISSSAIGEGDTYIKAYTFEQLYIVVAHSNLYKDQWFIDEFQGMWLLGYPLLREDDVNYSPTLADAAAEAVLWCIKNNYIKVEK